MNPFQQLKKTCYKRVDSPYLPCKPGNTFRTALVEGQEAPIEVYNERKLGRKPELLDQYLKRGYSFSETRKRQIHEKLFVKPLLGGIFNMIMQQSKLETLART